MKDVKVTIAANKKCPFSSVGQWFVVKGTKIYHPDKQGICLYALSAMMPHLTLLQTDPGSTDHIAAGVTEMFCPHDQVTFRAERLDDFDVSTL
jgi:uncharacterized repeat protein (TIGR04076 family)